MKFRQTGSDIRGLRKSRRMTLQSLAEKLDRSAGWLSLVERGATVPSVRDLEKIADFFGLTISFFFRSSGREDAEQGLVLRQTDRLALGSRESGLIEELLSPTMAGGFQMLLSSYAPHSSSGPRRERKTEDGGLVISGRFDLTIGDETFYLETGDSFQFTDTRYSWANPYDEPAVVSWVIAPPTY